MLVIIQSYLVVCGAMGIATLAYVGMAKLNEVLK